MMGIIPAVVASILLLSPIDASKAVLSQCREKLAVIFEQNYQLWKSAIQKAKENGEIRQDLDVEETASMFWQMFFGTSFEESFFKGWIPKNYHEACTFSTLC